MSAAKHIPQWRLGPDPAVDFIDNLDERVHRAFGNTDVAYSHIEDRYVVGLAHSKDDEGPKKALPMMTSSTSEMQKQIEIFNRSVDVYAQEITRQKLGSHSKDVFDLTKAHKWSDVEDAMNLAVSAERFKTKNASGRIRSVLDCFSKASPLVVSFLKCLPNDSFGGATVLCGGLTIVFKAAERLTKTREITYGAIESIPVVIQNALDLAQVYTQNVFEDHISRLFVAILDLLHKIFEWYAENISRKYFKSIVHGDDYARSLDEKKSKMENLMKDVNDKAAIYQHGRVGRIEVKLGGIETSVGEVLMNTRDQKAQQAIIVKNNMRQQLQADMMLRNIHRQLVRKERARLEKKQQAVLSEQGAREQRRRKRNRLQYVLEDPSISTASDMQEVVEAGLAALNNMKKRATYISQSEEVSQWLASTEDEFLLIDSNEKPEPVSAASLFCAILVQSFDLIKPVICLYWFCGLHLETSVSMMVRSLGAQLLDQCDDRLNLPQRARHSELFDLWSALEVLESLVVGQLQFSSVVFVLDGFAHHDECSMADFVSLMQCLQVIAQRNNDDVNRVKVIMTSPWSCSSDEMDGLASMTMDVPASLAQYPYYTLDEEDLEEEMAYSANTGLKDALAWDVEGESEAQYEYQVDDEHYWY